MGVALENARSILAARKRAEEELLADGERIVTFDKDVDVYAGGSMPLPPYVNRPSDENDAARYQTVFAREAGAVAAPTAGLHFTSEILSEIPHTFVTLHVGPGTFLPVRCEEIPEHRMHVERFSLSPEAADKINNAQRIVAVGTTAMRVLETATRNTKLVSRQVEPQSGETDLFVYPPFTFRGAVEQFSSPALDLADAGECVCWTRIHSSCVRGSGP